MNNELEEIKKDFYDIHGDEHQLLMKKINEMKEQINNIDGILLYTWDYIKNNRKVLQELIKQFEDSHDEVINRRFFTRLLENLEDDKK